ncbi:unnamed protein product [Rotaria magnacalcarata]|uniref:Vacuolar protein sorting-associated protein 54 C-terminal domain-containing protein n=6 Tax=Rotaria magnacalcarata TaxID=392030 RepID=A0A819FE79_9BILA|nr:unnamed protein product [Rotaria magnacalcarata]CAF1642740.1 unnamed protein product [Rotaria magnacalcarata]CAF2144384.1 unnamed protein product [Rotaria magnacalcarata]CAF2151112.1 unnamed protein product [Rotaria magnacalcarata]CAF2213868.1 unnamed protein product [Rotaria magnacalcarata]
MSHSLVSSFNNRKKLIDGDSSTTISTIFQSNLACVLNDPKKTRAEISTFFTKTWGNSFVDRSPDQLTRLGDYSLNDFEIYFNSLRKSEKYGRPRMRQNSSNDSNISQKPNSVINIPQLFFSSQFTLSDTSTFNLVFPGIIPISRQRSPIHFEQQKTRTTSTSSEKSEGNNRRQSTSSATNTTKATTNGTLSGSVSNSSSPKHSISSTTRLLQDKYTHYLDEVELLITRALSTKSHCFHDAVRSHDEIQSFLNTTRHAISSLRGELSNYDSQSLLTLLRLYRLLRQRQNQRQLLKRLESLSIVKQTHMQVRALLTTSDYLSALDLIDVTREIISTQLNDLVCLRFYDTQLNEYYLLIINLMRQEFGQYLTNQLLAQQDLILSNDYVEEDKLITILIGLIRVNDDKYVDEIRSKFEQFILDIIERAISSNSKDIYLEKSNKTTAKTNSEQSSLNEESSTIPRYNYPSSINSNSGSFSSWIRLATLILTSTEQGLYRLRNLSQYINDALLKHQLKNTSSIGSLLNNIYDTVQDRLTVVLTQECARYQVHFERLSLDEYSQIVKLIENFILHVNGDDKKYKSRPLRTFLQSQTSKFLTHFHDERKQRVVTTLDNEQWKQVPVPRSIQNSVDELFNLSSSINSNGSETLTIDNEHFIVSNSALHLFMLVLDYCSCAQLLTSSSINDVEHRLIELLNLFNSKTCQSVLGAGAVKLGKIKTISAKILAITCRCLQFIKIILPKIKSHYDQLQASSESTSTISSISSAKQFEQLAKLYSEHIDEIHGKLISIIETTFNDTLSSYEVRAPMPSDCFRTLVTRHITAFYNAVARIVSPSDLILLFTRLNSIFKQLLAKRLRQLRIANDGGPQHGLLTSDLLYYIKQVQSFPGLEMLELHVDEIWTTN